MLKKTLYCILICLSYNSLCAQESANDFINAYTGTTEYNSTTGVVTITGSGQLRFPAKGIKDFIWDVPATVTKIFIKSNVTVDAAFHVSGKILIQGEDRNTSVIFGTNTQAWPLNAGVEGKEQEYGQIQAEEKKWSYFVLSIDNLTIKNARAYAVRCWDRPAHLSNCNVIDNRGGWKNHSDGFEGGHFSTITNCYFETGDDVIKIYKDLTVKNCTIKMILNAVPFQFGWGTYGDCVANIENVTIIGNSGRGEWEGSSPIFQWSAGTDRRTVTMKNCHFDVPHASLFDMGGSGGLDLNISNSYINVRQYAYQLNTWGNRMICGEREPKDKTFFDDTPAPYIAINSNHKNATVNEGSNFTVDVLASDSETSVDSTILLVNGTVEFATAGGTLTHTINNIQRGNHNIRIESVDTEKNRSYRQFTLVGKCIENCDNNNLLFNPDMESGKDPWVENVSGLWHNNNIAFQGNSSLEVVRGYSGYLNQGAKQTITQQLLAYGPGKYKISAMLKQAPGETISASASVFIKSEKGITPATNPDPNFKTPTIELSATEWREVSAIVDISWSKMYYAWFTVVSPTETLMNKTHYYVDNCVLQPIDASNYPTVTIISPKNDTTYTVGDKIDVKGSASYEKGSISSVVLALNGQVQKTFTTPPYEFTLNNVAAGKHTISLMATSNDNKTITATSTINVLPIVSAYQTFQAEANNGNSGGLKNDPYCVQHIGQIDGGEWIMYKNINFGTTNAKCIVNVTSNVTTGNSKIEIRLGAPNGQLVGEVPITSTGGWCNYKQYSGNISVAGVQNVYLVFVGGNDIFDLDWVKFETTTPSGINYNILQNVFVYSNTNDKTINIQLNENYPDAILDVYNLLGRKLISRALTTPHTTIRQSELSEKGMLIFRISAHNKSYNQLINNSL